MKAGFSYTAVIRTLGTAGDKYQRLLDSLKKQTVTPHAILVYIAEGYPLPKETIGTERYIYVKKGMVAQRALPYDEVETEWMLFLDDDVYLPPYAVEKLYESLQCKKADVIAPELFENAHRGWLTNIRMRLIGKSVPHKDDGLWAYKIRRNGGYSYNEAPSQALYFSQSNAGPCFFCQKETFRSVHFEEELWMDEVAYALPEDQVMYHKMYLHGCKILTWYNSGIKHLDAGVSRNINAQKQGKLLYSEIRNSVIYWHRFVSRCHCKRWDRCLDILSISWMIALRWMLLAVKCKFGQVKIWAQGVRDACHYIRSSEYQQLPPVINNNYL